MKRTFIITCLFACLSFFVAPLSAKTDIFGWGKVKWGMTYSQVAALYDLEDWGKDKPPRCYMKEGVIFHGHDFKLSFQFDERSSSGRLVKVALVDMPLMSSTAKSISKFFVEKYGKPDSTDREFGHTDLYWFKPTGHLMYHYIEEIGLFSLTYVAVRGSNREHFRGASWGMSKAQIKAKEPGEPKIKTDDIICYEGSVAGMDTLIAYIFVKDKLVRAKYLFSMSHSNKNDYISDYHNLKEALTKKYDQPKEEKAEWRNDLYERNYSDWGFAVSLGHLFYYSQWGTQDTDVVLKLYGENYVISLDIQYSSQDLKKLEEWAKEKKIEKEF